MNIKQTLIYHHLCGTINISGYINSNIQPKNYIQYIEHVGYNIYICENTHGLAKYNTWYWLRSELFEPLNKSELLINITKIENNIEGQLRSDFKYFFTII